jgi:hypothetical protein
VEGESLLNSLILPNIQAGAICGLRGELEKGKSYIHFKNFPALHARSAADPNGLHGLWTGQVSSDPRGPPICVS